MIAANDLLTGPIGSLVKINAGSSQHGEEPAGSSERTDLVDLGAERQ